MKLHYYEYTIPACDEGRQIKSVLFRTLGFTAAKIRSAKFDEAGIFLDGIRTPVTFPVHEGQTLSILLNDSENKDANLLSVPMDLDILYEDEDLLFLNKPAGVVCHPSKGHLTDSLANGVLHYFRQKEERSNVHLIGRLDRDTSGVVTIAKNGATADFLARARAEGAYSKIYHCIASGCIDVPFGTITTPMGEFRTDNGMLVMCEGNLPAVTHFEVVKVLPQKNATLCKVTIETGRTHQIRFHMASIGHALLGDAVYGQGETDDFSRSALHASEISFVHPYTKEHCLVRAPLPQDFIQFL